MADTTRVLTFHPEKCKGCLDCERACSKVHFKTEDGGQHAALRILARDGGWQLQVCNQCGLCIDMCPVCALERKARGIVLLSKSACTQCQVCVGFCPTGVMRRASDSMTPFKCISCGRCVAACPEGALELVDVPLDQVFQVVFHAYHE